MVFEYLSENKILLNCQAKDYQNLLAQMLALSNEKEYQLIIEIIMAREAAMPTTLGKGIALPRVILDKKDETEIIIALSPNGLNITGLDHEPVKIVFLHLFSKNIDYSEILAQNLRLLNDDSLRAKLLNVKLASEVIKLIKNWEQE